MIVFDEASIKDIVDRFESLTTKEQSKVMKSSLRQASSIITRETKRNLRIGIKNKGKGFQDMNKGVRVYVKKIEATITIYRSRKYHYSYLWQFLEAGTAERVLKHKQKKNDEPWKVGKITARRFFANAVNSKGQQAIGKIKELIGKNIIKVWENGK